MAERTLDEDATLPLFEGAHIPRIRFENALERLDLRAALADAPPTWREVVAAMAAAVGARSATRADLDVLVRCRRADWPPVLERTWQRLVGRRLDAHGIPQTLDDQPAAAYLLRGGERERARKSIGRHLQHHPRDARGWELFAHFQPVLGAARCAFHGGPLLPAAGDLIDAVTEDGLKPVEPWLLSYGWFAHKLALGDIAQALEAEHLIRQPQLLVPGDAKAFAWYVLDAGGRPFGPDSVGVIEARKRLQRISRDAFQRYLARVAGKSL
jgi:hypothetical protein